MKLLVKDATTQKPLMNTKIQLQVKGKDSGFLTLMTDGTGNIQLDDKYEGQQLMSAIGGKETTWTTATEGATVTVSKQKTTEPTSPTMHSSK